MPRSPTNEARDREIKRRLNGGERTVDLAAEYGLTAVGVYKALNRLRAKDRRADHASMVQLGQARAPRRAVSPLSLHLQAEIAAARAEMATTKVVYRGGW